MVDKECRELLDKLELSCGKSVMWLFPRIEGWSDEKLAGLRCGLSFSPAAYDRGNLKWILIRFFDLYLTGTVQKEDLTTSIVFDIIALSEINIGRLWSAPTPGTAAFYQENVSKPNSLSVVTESKASKLKFLNKQWGVKQQVFWNYINTVIKNINPIDTATKAETQLIRLASFLAIIFLQCTVKTQHQVAHFFNRSQYRKNMADSGVWPMENPFSPPCDKCLEICELHFGKEAKSMPVYEIVPVKEHCDCNRSATAILEAALLDDLAGYGVGMVKLVEDVSAITSLSWRDLMKITSFPVTERSWSYLSKFFESQESNPQLAYKWARIIDDRYFQGLSPKKNVILATILAAIVEKAKGPEIWNAKWAKKANNSYKLMGYKLYDQIFKDSK